MKNRVIVTMKTFYERIVLHVYQIQICLEKLSDPMRDGLFIDPVQRHNQKDQQDNIPTI